VALDGLKTVGAFAEAQIFQLTLQDAEPILVGSEPTEFLQIRLNGCVVAQSGERSVQLGGFSLRGEL